MDSLKKEAFLRLIATFLLVLTACLVGFDTQTKVLFYSITKKATFRNLCALSVLICIDSAAAAYNVLQVLRCCLRPSPKEYFGRFDTSLSWIIYFLDQVVVYLVFAANSAALSGASFALTGQSSFQWMKVCDRFTRFCFQIGGALLCGYAASILLAVISSLSACKIFRIYSPKNFLKLKNKH